MSRGKISGFFGFLDRQDQSVRLLVVILVTILIAIKLPLGWTGNEENYFLLSFKTVEPDAFGPYSAVFDKSSGKGAGFWIFGTLIQLLGYDGAHTLLLLTAMAATAIALAMLAVHFRLSILDTLVVLAVFLILGQASVGGEWFIGGVETKTFAYVFELIGIVLALRGRWLASTLWMVASTYLHFQVGGFGLILIVAALILTDRDWKNAARAAGLYILLALPLAVMIALDQLGNAGVSQPPGVPTADYIYAVIRAPHHMAPFSYPGDWSNSVYIGVASALGFIVAGALAWRMGERRLAVLAGLVIGLSCYILLATAISYLDRHTAILGKLYLFRPAMLMLLFAIIMGLMMWRRWTETLPLLRFGPYLTVLAIFAALAANGRFRNQLEPLDAETKGMAAAVQERAGKADPVILDAKTDALQGLIRHLDRQTFVAWKFIPTNPAEIYRWWDLLEQRKRLFAGNCQAHPPTARFVVAAVENAAPLHKCGRTIWSNGAYEMIALR